MAEDEFDRVLDGQNMATDRVVAMVEHRRERGRFTRTGRADHQYHSGLIHDHILQHRREAELVDCRNIPLDIADDH